METVTTVLIGVGGLLIILSLFLGIVELATLRTIRPPEQKTFTYIRLAANQYQNIVVPAMGALISGLFVSMSASFFYEGITNEDDSWRQPTGSAIFIAGAVALAITLRAVLKGVGEPAELARDPFTIRAAADEYSANPRRGSLDPSFLEERMDEWEQYISARAMNIAVEKDSPRLARALTGAAAQSGFWRSVVASLHVYFAALLRFPFRFAWPLLGFLLLSAGVIWYAVGDAGLDFATSWRPIAAVVIFVVGSVAVTLFYCATRGNRARLWHRINLVAVADARKAIDSALRAHTSVTTEDAVLQRVIQRADSFLQDERAGRAKAGFVFNLGKFRVAITSKTTMERPKRTS